MKVFQIIRATKKIKEDFKIGFEKIWLYAKYDAGEYTRYPGKNHCCS